MDFDYFYGRGADQFAFYQIPKILITDEKFAGITMESKILYSLMLDRASLSAKNGWLDEDGKVFIYYKLDRIMADMHCANQKATKMLKELEDKAGLIERQKQGQGKPTKIYVKDFATGLHDYGPDRRIIQTHENHDSETHENHESRNVIITGPDSWKSCTNNTNYNNTDFNNTNLINLSAESASPKIKVVKAQEKEDSIRLREQYEDYLREKLEIDILSQRNPYEVRRINEILEIMVDVLNSKAKTIRISGEDKPTEVVKAQFMKLDSSHMEYILDCFKHQASDIHNIKQYLLTTIYNAPLTIDHYYTAKVCYEHVRKNLDAVRVPFGTCFKPAKIECKSQTKMCLECASFCSSKDDLPMYDAEISRVKALISIAEKTGREDWTDKNHQYLNNLYSMKERILQEGIIHKNGKLREESDGR